MGSSLNRVAVAAAVVAFIAFDKPAAGEATGSNGAAGSNARAVDAGPVLLGLSPDSGPRDGNTRVHLEALGLNSSIILHAVLRGVWPRGQVENQGRSVTVPTNRSHETGELFFIMPNLTDVRGVGVLVTLTDSPTHRGRGLKPHQSPLILGPLFFRLYEPVAKLAPAAVSPCCDFKMSGGQALMLSGQPSVSAPGHRAVVRFRGNDHQKEVNAQMVLAEWDLPLGDTSSNTSDKSWHLYAVTPPWPRIDDDVVLELAWNSQQFAEYPTRVKFIQQKSFFGDLPQGLSEQHLEDPDTAADLADEGDDNFIGTAEVAVVESGEEGTETLPGQEPDLSNAFLLDSAGDTFIMARFKDLSQLQQDLRIIHDLFLLTSACSVGGAVAAALHAPVIIGFLMGGTGVGPGGLDWVVELVQVESVAQLGVCLLLFSIGLELTLEELVRNSRAAAAGLLAMALLCGLVVFLAAFCIRTPVNEAFFIGLFASLASTPVSLRAVPGRGSGDSNHADTDGKAATVDSEAASGAGLNGEASTLLAILVTQDCVLAALLAVMPLLFRPSRPSPVPVSDPDEDEGGRDDAGMQNHTRVWIIAGVAVVCCGAAVMCRRALKKLARKAREYLGAFLMRMEADFFVMLMLSYAFCMAYLTEWAGLSAELGAFLAGMALTAVFKDVSHRTEHLMSGLKDTFVAWFFGSIGLVVNPRFLLDNLRAVLTVVLIVFIMKLITGMLPLWLFLTRGDNRPILNALRPSWVLAHVSEFGFVLAAKGASWGVLSRHVYLLLVGANAVSLCLAPWLFRARDVLMPEVGEDEDAGRRGHGEEAGLCSASPRGFDLEVEGFGERSRQPVPAVIGAGELSIHAEDLNNGEPKRATSTPKAANWVIPLPSSSDGDEEGTHVL